MTSSLKVEPIKTKTYESKQSKIGGELVPTLPCRSLILSPSGGGKTVLLQNLILNVYKGCFERIYIFSPSINIDHTWEPVKDYIKKEIKPQDREKCYFDAYDPVELANIIMKQNRVVEYQKNMAPQGVTSFRYSSSLTTFPTTPASRETASYYTACT